jgi:predicted nucleotide-binding protein
LREPPRGGSTEPLLALASLTLRQGVLKLFEVKPKVFIGSSTESRPLAETLARLLAKECTPVGWWKAFKLSEFTLESLLKQIDDYDFGIFVFAPDDKIEIRGQSFWAPRDNVSLELGMFLAHLGRERTFIVEARTPEQGQQDLRSPSDLRGLVVISVAYGRGDTEGERDQDRKAAAARVCSQLRKAISANGCRLRTPTLDRLKHLAGLAVKGGTDVPLYTFSGQELHPCNLKGPARFDRTSVFTLWADPVGENSIRVSLEFLGERSCLRIRFEVQYGCLPSDVTIRPCGLKALANSPLASFLVFHARAPISALNSQLKERGRLVGLAIRIIDRRGTQWKFQEEHHTKVFPIPVDDEWHDVRIDLKPGAWIKFPADGNHLFAEERPDFSVISAVIAEVGAWADGDPNHGTGEVWISNLYLDDESEPV